MHSIYVRYDSWGRRKLFWTIWENRRGNFSCYEEFKDSWNPDTKVWKTIKDELKINLEKKVQNLLHVKRPFDNPIQDRSKSYNIGDRSRKGSNMKHIKRTGFVMRDGTNYTSHIGNNNKSRLHPIESGNRHHTGVKNSELENSSTNK